MTQPNTTNPLNPVSPPIMALFLTFIGIEAALSLGASGTIGGPGAVGWRNEMIGSFGFQGAYQDWMFETGAFPLDYLMRYLTYPFLHANFTHALVAGVMFLAMGKMVSDSFGGLATIVVFFVSAVLGAFVYGLVLDQKLWLIGAYPGTYGLIGGFSYLMWLKLGQLGENQMRAFTLIAFLMGIQLLFGLLFGGQSTWIADVSGFAAGFLISFVVSPGGFAKIRGKLRHD